MKRARYQGWGARLLLAAALAVLAQSLLGPAVMARPLQGQTIEICTAHGIETMQVSSTGEPVDKAPAPCSHCDHCILASTIPAPVGHVLEQPVHYLIAKIVHRPGDHRQAAYARGPPRPPGQAPPFFLNV